MNATVGLQPFDVVNTPEGPGVVINLGRRQAEVAMSDAGQPGPFKRFSLEDLTRR